MLNSPDFKLLVDCIKAECAAAEVDAARFGIWREFSNIANEKARPHVLNAQVAKNALDMIETIGKQDFQFSQIVITP